MKVARKYLALFLVLAVLGQSQATVFFKNTCLFTGNEEISLFPNKKCCDKNAESISHDLIFKKAKCCTLDLKVIKSELKDLNQTVFNFDIFFDNGLNNPEFLYLNLNPEYSDFRNFEISFLLFCNKHYLKYAVLQV